MRVGGRWRFECSDRAGRPANGITEFECHGKVLEIDPPRRFVYTWIANWHEHPEHATTVRWDLERTSRGTRVRVTHSGLADEPIARKDYSEGWVGVLRLLEGFFVKLAAR